MPGQPASDRSPRSWPSRAGASSSAQRCGCGRVAEFHDVDLPDRQCRRQRLQEGARGLGVLDDVVGEAAGHGDRMRRQHALRRDEAEEIRHDEQGGRASSRRREHGEPGRAQHAGQPDERQADQRGRIVAVDALEQRDAERFGADAAGAIVGSLAPQIGVDLGGGQEPERAADVDERASGIVPVAASSSASPVWKMTVLPDSSASCATARS